MRKSYVESSTCHQRDKNNIMKRNLNLSSLNLMGILLLSIFAFVPLHAQTLQEQRAHLAPTPPMGWMSWNLFQDKINEQNLREMADAMVSQGLDKLGYRYIFIDDCWQGGRDNRNNIIPDPQKFPSGMKALCDYIHSLGLKVGIYSCAAPLTCAGFTASLGFEEQDAQTFASWGIDYLKYDYCNAPEDCETAEKRYRAMAEALTKSGRDIALGACEWGPRKPWLWAAQAGAQTWRTTFDIRDMWTDSIQKKGGVGILDDINENADLAQYAGPGHWNDMDMLNCGLYGKGGPSSDLGGTGCTDTEYQTQMSLWCMLGSQLSLSCDLRTLNAETRRIIGNEEIIAIDQDPLGKVARRVLQTPQCQVFLRPLSGDRYAVAILNHTDRPQHPMVRLTDLDLKGKYRFRDVWQHRDLGKTSSCQPRLHPHETTVYVLRKND